MSEFTLLSANADEILNTLILERSVDGRLAVVVEGPEDFFLMNMHTQGDLVKLTPAYSKTAALGVAQIAATERIDWIFVVFDSDFDLLASNSPRIPGTAQTEYYDLAVDAMVADPSVLRSTIAGLGSPERQTEIYSLHSDGGVARILESATVIGRLRYLVVVEKRFELSTRQWRPKGLIKAPSIERHVAEQGSRRSGGTATSEEIEAALLSATDNVDPLSLLCGHDVVDLIVDLLNGAAHRATVEAAIRSGVRCDIFLGLKPVREVQHWATTFGIWPWTCLAA